VVHFEDVKIVGGEGGETEEGEEWKGRVRRWTEMRKKKLG
jgi:hypothetical protein